MKLDLLSHQIICFCASRVSEDDNYSMYELETKLKETFPNCSFCFFIDEKHKRLSVTTNFIRYWFDILDDDCKDLRFLTVESLR